MITEETRKEFANYGSIGGKKTKEKYGTKHLSEAGKKGAKVRWENAKKLSTGKGVAIKSQ